MRSLLILLLLLLIVIFWLTITHLTLALLNSRLIFFLMRLVLLLHIIALFLALLSLLFLLLRLLTKLLCSACNKLFNFLLLQLFIILLGGLSSLQLLGLGLPFHHLISDDVYRVRIVNPGSDVVLQLSRIALAIEVGIEQHPEISESKITYYSLSF
jgi:hypothetical protein